MLGCSREAEVGIRTAKDLKGRHVAHMSSDFHKKELVALQPDIVFDPYSEFSFAIESLRGRKIDAISLGKDVCGHLDGEVSRWFEGFEKLKG